MNTASRCRSRELQRTRRSELGCIVIIPTTGARWVDPVAARSIESMYNGDTALAGHAVFVSAGWISFLADQQKSVEWQERWSRPSTVAEQRWPADRRPRLALYGEPRLDGGQEYVQVPADVVDMNFSPVLVVR